MVNGASLPRLLHVLEGDRTLLAHGNLDFLVCSGLFYFVSLHFPWFFGGVSVPRAGCF